MAQAIDCLTSICTFIDAEKQKISAARKIKAKVEEKLKSDEESKQPSGQNEAAALQSDSSMVDESVNQGQRQSDELSLGIEIEPGLRDQLRDQYIEEDYEENDENDENDAEESDESGDDDEEDEDEDNLEDDESDDDDDDGDFDEFVRRRQRRRVADAAAA